jgi:Fe-S cluster biogenesis protein NfuA
MTTDQLVLQALDEVRPALQVDGGDVELVEVLGSTVRVRLLGACRDCPARELTLKHILLRALEDRAPSVRAVEAV